MVFAPACALACCVFTALALSITPSSRSAPPAAQATTTATSAATVASAATAASAATSGSPWNAQDSLAAVRIVDALVHRPESVDSLTAGSLSRDHGLGFGRHLREVWINPAGTLGFSLKIVYEGTRPVSFEARPVMNYGGLRARYQAILAPAFKTSAKDAKNLYAEPYRWNMAAVAAPLPEDSLNLGGDSLPAPALREALAFYMTPYSGTLYGIRGGEAGQMLENRDHFLGLAEILMADKHLARYLLRSANPATRLTAAEFIIRHRENFPEYDSLQRTAFRAVFANPSKAATMRMGRETSEDARKLVLEYSRQDARRDGRGVLRMY
ncbi:MAG: hypothetical protein JWO30_377 [Fibrobacteres bacterium]|nr:hypothetical protein [Fibrobacterota bacterium]